MKAPRGVLFLIALVAAILAINGSSSKPKPESPVDVYQRSWEKKALAQQRSLEANLPFKDSTFLHSHNTYNASAYTIAFSYIDPNHNFSVNDQLRMDIRAIDSTCTGISAWTAGHGNGAIARSCAMARATM